MEIFHFPLGGRLHMQQGLRHLWKVICGQYMWPPHCLFLTPSIPHHCAATIHLHKLGSVVVLAAKMWQGASEPPVCWRWSLGGVVKKKKNTAQPHVFTTRKCKQGLRQLLAKQVTPCYSVQNKKTKKQNSQLSSCSHLCSAVCSRFAVSKFLQ